MKVINVASKSSTNDLAELIIASVDEGVILKGIGAGAVNQAIKGVAVAEQRIENSLKCKPSFFNVVIEGQEKSGISLKVEKEEK